MKTTIENGWVTVASDDGLSSSSMTLEQYEKHARDPDFVKALDSADHQAVLAACRAPRAVKGAG